jgi:hypothetical protein
MEPNKSKKGGALHLLAQGEYVVLNIEKENGEWVELIKERLDSPFSHIIEPLGIERKVNGENGVSI